MEFVSRDTNPGTWESQVGTDSHGMLGTGTIRGTLWTGTKIVWTVPEFSALGHKSLGQKCPGFAL